METPVLNATTRTILGKQVKQIRREGQLPGVVYGNSATNQNIALNAAEYHKLFKRAGTSTLVDLVIDSQKPVKVLLHEPQEHPTRSDYVHADFYIVKMNEKLQTEIPLEFVGESEAVTTLDGTLNPHIDALEVECFPDKLVSVIEVDITALKTLDDVIRISDITLPEGIEVLAELEDVVATVTPPRSEEEMAELDSAVGEDADKAAVEAVEVTEEKKEEKE